MTSQKKKMWEKNDVTEEKKRGENDVTSDQGRFRSGPVTSGSATTSLHHKYYFVRPHILLLYKLKSFLSNILYML